MRQRFIIYPWNTIPKLPKIQNSRRSWLGSYFSTFQVLLKRSGQSVLTSLIRCSNTLCSWRIWSSCENILSAFSCSLKPLSTYLPCKKSNVLARMRWLLLWKLYHQTTFYCPSMIKLSVLHNSCSKSTSYVPIL